MKLSVVTALKDGFEHFAETLPTVLGQTHRDWEWILVDDGSRPPLRDHFPELAADPRVRLLRYDASRGQTEGLNEGIRLSQADWIVRVDADDLFSPNRFEAIVAHAADRRLLFSDYDVIDEKGALISEVRYRTPLAARFFRYLEKKNNPICHPAVAFHKRAPDGALYQYRSDLRNAQDYELWKRIVRDWGPVAVACIPLPLVRYRVVSSSLSGAMALEQKQELAKIKGHELTRPATPAPLGARERRGMQAYRLLFYRWLDRRSTASAWGGASLVRDAAGYPANFAKALFYGVSRPFKGLLKRAMLGGIYR